MANSDALAKPNQTEDQYELIDKEHLALGGVVKDTSTVRNMEHFSMIDYYLYGPIVEGLKKNSFKFGVVIINVHDS